MSSAHIAISDACLIAMWSFSFVVNLVFLIKTLIAVKYADKNKTIAPRIMLTLNIMFLGIHVADSCTKLESDKPGASQKTWSGVNLSFLIIDISFYLWEFMYILFCWITIVAKHSFKIDNKTLRFRALSCAIAINVWVAAWLIGGIANYKLSMGKGKTPGPTPEAVEIIKIMIGALALVPLVISIGFVIFFRQMRKLVNDLQNGAKRDVFGLKLTILSGAVLCLLYLHILFAILTIYFPGTPYYELILGWSLLYGPQALLSATVMWFFNPFTASRMAESSSRSTKSTSKDSPRAGSIHSSNSDGSSSKKDSLEVRVHSLSAGPDPESELSDFGQDDV